MSVGLDSSLEPFGVLHFRGQVGHRVDLESVAFGLPRTDENSPGIPDREGERATPLSKLCFDEDDINVDFDVEVWESMRLEVPEAQMQKSEARIAGHWRWLESTGVSAYVTVHIGSCRWSLYEDPS